MFSMDMASSNSSCSCARALECCVRCLQLLHPGMVTAFFMVSTYKHTCFCFDLHLIQFQQFPTASSTMMLWSTMGQISWMKPGAIFSMNSNSLKILMITPCSWGLDGSSVQLSGCQVDMGQSRMTRSFLDILIKNGNSFGPQWWKMGLGLFQV